MGKEIKNKQVGAGESWPIDLRLFSPGELRLCGTARTTYTRPYHLYLTAYLSTLLYFKLRYLRYVPYSSYSI